MVPEFFVCFRFLTNIFHDFFMALFFPGSDSDDQIDCVLRMVPVCALYAGRPEMLDRVEDVLRVTQNSDTAVSVGLAAAR